MAEFPKRLPLRAPKRFDGAAGFAPVGFCPPVSDGNVPDGAWAPNAGPAGLLPSKPPEEDGADELLPSEKPFRPFEVPNPEELPQLDPIFIGWMCS